MLVLLSVLMPPGIARAVELGIDAGVNVSMLDNSEQKTIGVGIPLNEGLDILSIQTARLGLPVSSSGQVETSLGFSLVRQEGFSGNSSTLAHFLGGLSYLQPFSSATPRSSPYIRGGVQFRVLAASDETPVNQFGFGAGLGYRWKIGQVFGGRVEGFGARWPENDDIRGHWDLTFRVGLSAFSS